MRLKSASLFLLSALLFVRPVDAQEATATPVSTSTPIPTVVATATPAATSVPTSTPVATATVVPTASPSIMPSTSAKATTKPVVKIVTTKKPSASPVSTPLPTSMPVATANSNTGGAAPSVKSYSIESHTVTGPHILLTLFVGVLSAGLLGGGIFIVRKNKLRHEK